jgi:long-subunit fatty acid transport protein
MLGFGATVIFSLLAGPVAATPETRGGPAPAAIVDQDEVDLSSQSNFVLGVGARALGMGGAFLARPDDATAASWNPAGLSYLRRPEVSIVGNYLTFRSTFSTDRTEANATTLDFLAVTYPLKWGGTAGSAQVSYQRAIPFNLDRTTVVPATDVAPEFERIYESDGGFDVLAFGLGWKVTRTLRVGGTFNRWFNGYEQNFERTSRRRTERTDTFELDGWNVNLGVIWSPVEELNLAVVGKTPFTADVVLERTRTDFVTQEGGPDDELGPVFVKSDDVRLEFPGAWGVGASWRPRSTLTVAADYTRTYWSKARIENYFTLLEVTDESQPTTNYFVSLVWPNVDAESQADSIQLRFGIEYVILGSKVKVPVRAGYVNDQIYTKDYQGEAPHFNAVTAGTGLIAGSALFDIAYQYQWGSYRAPDSAGSAAGIPTSVKTHRFYASVIYRWGGIR